jgi:hypothetical protein
VGELIVCEIESPRCLIHETSLNLFPSALKSVAETEPRGERIVSCSVVL